MNEQNSTASPHLIKPELAASGAKVQELEARLTGVVESRQVALLSRGPELGELTQTRDRLQGDLDAERERAELLTSALIKLEAEQVTILGSLPGRIEQAKEQAQVIERAHKQIAKYSKALALALESRTRSSDELYGLAESIILDCQRFGVEPPPEIEALRQHGPIFHTAIPQEAIKLLTGKLRSDADVIRFRLQQGPLATRRQLLNRRDRLVYRAS